MHVVIGCTSLENDIKMNCLRPWNQSFESIELKEKEAMKNLLCNQGKEWDQLKIINSFVDIAMENSNHSMHATHYGGFT